MTRPDWYRIVVCGVGGQGVLLVSRILCEAAMRADVSVVSGEIRNMAQRGGAVQASVVLGGARSSVVPRGGADVVLALEPMEAARVSGYMSERTLVITNTHPVVPFTLSVQGRPYPPIDGFLSSIDERCGALFAVDATRLAEEVGSIRVLNTLMLGILAGRSSLPIGNDVLERTIAEESPKAHVQINLDAFRTGLASAGTNAASTGADAPGARSAARAEDTAGSGDSDNAGAKQSKRGA
jgi:indolepyruvate ferredoxin oxidoreductase beta subunit